MTKIVNRSPIRVLIVDDEALANSHVQLQLEQLGYEVIGNAYDGSEAVRLTQELHPDVVLMDLHMVNPETGKEERTAGLKATYEIQKLCPTPVVIISAYESQELVQQASLIGAGAYLVKPTREHDLERAITIALARFRDFMELRRLNADLASYNAELDAFASAVSQGLKAHLNFIATHIEHLIEHQASYSRPALLEQVQSITCKSYIISNIREELLVLARLRRPGPPTLHPLNMEEIFKKAQCRLQALPQYQHAHILAPAIWPTVEGQTSWVTEIWVSLLCNALKYGQPAQPPFCIEVGAERQEANNMVRFWVRDFGPGISPEQQAEIFQPPAQQEPVHGEGLKLHLVRLLCEKMGGDIGVLSPVPTQAGASTGSLFYFTLPASTL